MVIYDRVIHKVVDQLLTKELLNLLPRFMTFTEGFLLALVAPLLVGGQTPFTYRRGFHLRRATKMLLK